MGANIKRIERGVFARSQTVNELIDAINSLTSATIREGTGEESPRLIYAERKSELITTAGKTDEDDSGGGENADGYQIYWADGTTTFLDNDTVMGSFTEGTDTDWSIEFEISASEFTKTVEYNTDTALYDGDASADPAEAQEFYRLPIVRNSQRLSFGGAYRENIFCAGNKGPIVELVKIA